MNTSLRTRNIPDRVRRSTRDAINARIDARTRASLDRYHDAPAEVITRRVEALEREWDIERVLETNASTLALTGVVLAATVDRRWLLLSGTVLGFLLLHATRGWCPPLPILRARGVRTRAEIDEEKYGLLDILHRRIDVLDAPLETTQAVGPAEVGTAV